MDEDAYVTNCEWPHCLFQAAVRVVISSIMLDDSGDEQESAGPCIDLCSQHYGKVSSDINELLAWYGTPLPTEYELKEWAATDFGDEPGSLGFEWDIVVDLEGGDDVADDVETLN